MANVTVTSSLVSSCDNMSSTGSLPEYQLLGVGHAFGCLSIVGCIFLNLLVASVLNGMQYATAFGRP